MRILVLTLMMSFLSHSAFGADRNFNYDLCRLLGSFGDEQRASLVTALEQAAAAARAEEADAEAEEVRLVEELAAAAARVAETEAEEVRLVTELAAAEEELEELEEAEGAEREKKNRTCGGCPKRQKGMKRCSRCETVYYCSLACQKQGWKSHKHKCHELYIAKCRRKIGRLD